MNSMRTRTRAVSSGMTRTSGESLGCFGGSSGTPTAAWVPARVDDSSSERAEKLGAQAGHAEHARADVRPDHGADLRDEGRVAPVDLAAALDEVLGLGRGLDVLDGERVAAVGIARLEVRDQPLERAARRAHPLDGLHLALDREDRLDL